MKNKAHKIHLVPNSFFLNNCKVASKDIKPIKNGS
jgi:hypothetical protein